MKRITKIVCAPVKSWPHNRCVDLYEFTHPSRKLLYDRHEKLQWIDIDWREKPVGFDRLIISYHDFHETPDLETILMAMKARHPQAGYYKIATWARSTLDALRMIHFQRRHANVIGLCMGEKGNITRILSPFTYAPLREEDKNAPGQLLWSELETIYRYPAISYETRLYGLIGDPVGHSIGHLYHNDQFQQKQRDAVYIKMNVIAEEVPAFFTAIQGLPFWGFSVTAPLKEKMGSPLPMNTLVRTHDTWELYNTDGIAAADILEPVKGKQVVILGTGGAAKAIATELLRRKAHVKLLKRGMPIPFYDILINATSSPNPEFEYRFLPTKTVMDIATRETPFLQRARAHGCYVIDGFPMYFKQALLQSLLWKS